MANFRKIVSTTLLMAMTATGTATMVRAADATPVVQTAGSRQLPAAPAPVQSSAPATALSSGQLTTIKGEGPWGWLKKIWKKYKKKIIKIVWEIIKIIVEEVLSSTTQAVENVNGEIVEHHQGEEQTEENYNSQSDYDAGNVQSSSYADYGYQYQYTDYSSGSYEY